MGFTFFLFLLSAELVDALDQTEYRKCSDQEVDYGLNEHSVFDLCRFEACNGREGDSKPAEVDTADKIPDSRRDNIAYQRCYDGRKCSTDDDTDCHIHDISSGDKLFEFGDKAFLFFFFVRHTATSFLLLIR